MHGNRGAGAERPTNLPTPSPVGQEWARASTGQLSSGQRTSSSFSMVQDVVDLEFLEIQYLSGEIQCHPSHLNHTVTNLTNKWGCGGWLEDDLLSVYFTDADDNVLIPNPAMLDYEAVDDIWYRYDRRVGHFRKRRSRVLDADLPKMPTPRDRARRPSAQAADGTATPPGARPSHARSSATAPRGQTPPACSVVCAGTVHARDCCWSAPPGCMPRALLDQPPAQCRHESAPPLLVSVCRTGSASGVYWAGWVALSAGRSWRDACRLARAVQLTERAAPRAMGARPGWELSDSGPSAPTRPHGRHGAPRPRQSCRRESRSTLGVDPLFVGPRSASWPGRRVL